MLGSKVNHALNAAEQMGLDEAILDLAPPDTVVLRIYEWDGPAVTFGYSQNLAAAEAAARERGLNGVPIVRRSTGGGIVFHDGDFTFSIVFPWDKTCAPETIYKNIHRGMHLGLKSLGTPSSLWSSRAAAGAAPRAQCFSAPEPMDLVDERGRKALGGALRKRNGKGLYQGSMRLEVFQVSQERAAQAVTIGLSKEFSLPQLTLRQEWIARGREAAAKYASREWNARR